MNCKPCITIRAFFFLLKKNYQQFRKDLRDYSLINYYACELPKYKGTPLDLEGAMKRLKEIRQTANEKYDPAKEKEFYESLFK